MSGKRWRKAGALAALSLSLAAPVGARLLFGDGEPAGVEHAVEYHNASLGEFIVTVSADEIAALDAGMVSGWVRNRFAFFTLDGPASVGVGNGKRATASPVCRYFILPASHFLSASSDECAAVGAQVEGALLETEAAFYAWLPGDDGRCPRLFAKIGGFSIDPVYRLFGGQGTAHRLTASRTERDALVAEGWVPEGPGDGVAMCVPSWDSN